MIESPEEKRSGSNAWIAAVATVQRFAAVLPLTVLCGGTEWVVKRSPKIASMQAIQTRKHKGYTFITQYINVRNHSIYRYFQRLQTKIGGSHEHNRIGNQGQ